MQQKRNIDRTAPNGNCFAPETGQRRTPKNLRISTLNDSSICPRWVRQHPPQKTCNQMLCEPHLMEQPNKNGCQIMTQERKTHADLHQDMKAEPCGEGATSSCLASVHTTTTPEMSSIFCAPVLLAHSALQLMSCSTRI